MTVEQSLLSRLNTLKRIRSLFIVKFRSFWQMAYLEKVYPLGKLNYLSQQTQIWTPTPSSEIYLVQLISKVLITIYPFQNEKSFTTFESFGNLCPFLRIPFGVTNGVADFQRAIDFIIRNENLQACFAYR